MDELARFLAFLDHEGVTELVLGSNQPVTVRRDGTYIAVTAEPITQAQLARMLLGSPFEDLLPDGEGIGEMTEIDTGMRMVKAQIARRGSELLIRVEPMRRRGATAARKPAVDERRQKRASHAGSAPAPAPAPPPPPMPMPRTQTIERSRMPVAADPRNAEVPPSRPAPQPPPTPSSPATAARQAQQTAAMEAPPRDMPRPAAPPARPTPAPAPRAAPIPVSAPTPGPGMPLTVDLAPPHPYALDMPSVLELSPRAQPASVPPPPAPPPPPAVASPPPARTIASPPPRPAASATRSPVSPSGTFEAIADDDFELPPPVTRGASRPPSPMLSSVPYPTELEPEEAPAAYELTSPSDFLTANMTEPPVYAPAPAVAELPAMPPSVAAAPSPPPPAIAATGHGDAPSVQLIDERAHIEPILAIVRGCRDRGVTDLHIAANRPVMVRAIGELVQLDPTVVTPEMADAMLLPLLGPLNRGVLASRGYVDLALDIPQGGRLRGNVSRQKEGLKGSFRLARTTPPTLDELGLPPGLAKVVSHHQGLVVISGPSGHGKTTTLNALVDLINASRAHHILMIEDPVEIEHPRKRAVVSQREVGRHTTGFAPALKASLREDPDVIVIGELRDRETVEIALTAAETGHLVMTTMSTPSAAKTIDRLIDMFPAEDQPQVRASLGGALRAVIAQRLLPRANQKGVVAAVELLTGVLPLIALIRDNKLYQLPNLMQRGKAFGMIRLDDSLSELVRSGVVTEEVALRASDNRRELAAMLHPGDRPTPQPGGAPQGQAQVKKGGLFRRDKE